MNLKLFIQILNEYSRDDWEKETDLIIDYKITPDLKPVISKLEHNSKFYQIGGIGSGNYCMIKDILKKQ